MAYSAQDIEQSKALLAFLRTSFKGSSFGHLKIDDAVAAMERILGELPHDKPDDEARNG